MPNCGLSSSPWIAAVTLLTAEDMRRPTTPLLEDLNCMSWINGRRQVASCLPLGELPSNKDSWSPVPMGTPPFHTFCFRWSRAFSECLNQNKEDTAPLQFWVFIKITNNSLSLKSYIYLQWAMLPPADPTCQKYYCVFVFIVFVFHSCHGSKIYTQQPHCHFQLQMKLVCSQFGSAKKGVCIHYIPGPVLGVRPECWDE